MEQRLEELQRDRFVTGLRLREARQLERAYRAGIEQVLDRKWADAVLYQAEHRISGSADLGRMCVRRDYTLTEEERLAIIPPLRGDYRCDLDSAEIQNGLSMWSAYVREGHAGSIGRNICTGLSVFTSDDFDGELEYSGAKSQLRSDCMDGAQYLARVLDEIQVLDNQYDLDSQHVKLLERQLEELDHADHGAALEAVTLD